MGGVSAVAGDRITDVAGIAVGHHSRLDDVVTVGTPESPGTGWATGTTVLTVPEGAVTAVDVRGGGPGTRETDLLDPANTVQTTHAIVLGGGSAFGLAAADGVMLALEERGVGLPMDALGHVVPIVAGAVIFDLLVGDWLARPDAGFGAQALAAAAADFAIGTVGAGTGARAGALKGGIGTASLTLADGAAAGITVGALIVANPVGDVLDPTTGLPWGAGTADLEYYGLRPPSATDLDALAQARAASTTPLNTTIGVVATDADLDQACTKRIAMAAHDGLARAIVPAHSPLDGDTIFAVATGAVPGAARDAVREFTPVGMHRDVAIVAEVSAAAATVTQRAIVNAVLAATPVADIASLRSLLPSAVVHRTDG
ncbi:MAG TPA: P1 family peptidase [Gordonia sp. (in: high G+C Gram-positive bacteria)]|uniref:P1 family peptidase n=1 Tax=unclassified Gordonia (in: high G+C Gram-positive bacteria) TaxID=2657482 RepID=UPI000FBCE19E|nr:MULTISPECIES: P1 family peptidase [unclassified Gordonia (in: high G+C Gram-positive bacteria)]RUP40881.1 MAG: peptidase S58 family protein [Gordonia sp. (in: high G+C Gram-positive bacteria)]HNP57703.1 P1 family peptidase [Gordonia sp. (in: high G+C Gram-positive bacteria)]HRC51318.1 P1 family peptidase [Gordonia sp. (in: high G+C Gram-positive bacteria)]